MVNIYKYSTTLERRTIKSGNWLIGNEDVGYGETSITEFWNGVNIPDNSYLWMENKATRSIIYGWWSI